MDERNPFQDILYTFQKRDRFKNKEDRLSFLRSRLEEMPFDQNNLDSLLIRACEYNCDLDTLQLLIEAGANPRAKDDEAFLAIFFADDDITDVIMFFLELGVDPKMRNGEALSRACHCGNLISIEILLENGVPITEELMWHVITKCQSEKILGLFFEAGANPNLALRILLKFNGFDGLFKKIHKMDPDYDKVVSEL